MDIHFNVVDKINTGNSWRVKTTWEDMQVLMSVPVIMTPEERDKSPLFTGCLMKEYADAKHQEWGGYSRCHNNVIEVPFLVLDVDNQKTTEPYTIDDICEALNGIECLLYTSYNHRNKDKDNGVDKVRVIIPFTDPISAEDYQKRMESMRTTFPFAARESFTLSQPYWPPIVHPDRKHLFEYRKLDGELLDWRLFEEEKEREPYIIPEWKRQDNDIQDALSFIPNNDEDYMTWLSIGAAIRREMDGEDGLMLWKEWSSKSSKYNEKECNRAWITLNRQSGKIATAGTIFYLAKKNGWVRKIKDTYASRIERLKNAQPIRLELKRG